MARVGRCNGDDGAGLIVGRAAAGGRDAAGHMQSAGRGDGMVSDEGDVKTSYIGIVRHGDFDRLGVKVSSGGDIVYTDGFDVISIIADGDGELGFGRGLYVRANKCKVLVWHERDAVFVIDTMGSASIPWGRVSAGHVIPSDTFVVATVMGEGGFFRRRIISDSVRHHNFLRPRRRGGEQHHEQHHGRP